MWPGRKYCLRGFPLAIVWKASISSSATPHVFEKDRYKISVIRGISGILSGFSLVSALPKHIDKIVFQIIFQNLLTKMVCVGGGTLQTEFEALWICRPLEMRIHISITWQGSLIVSP